MKLSCCGKGGSLAGSFDVEESSRSGTPDGNSIYFNRSGWIMQYNVTIIVNNR
jgi:hypothetical protein